MGGSFSGHGGDRRRVEALTGVLRIYSISSPGRYLSGVYVCICLFMVCVWGGVCVPVCGICSCVFMCIKESDTHKHTEM